MHKAQEKRMKLKRRQGRIRKKIFGTKEQPRLSIYKGLSNTYVQVINDETGETFVSASSLNKEIKQKIKYGGNIAAAKLVGTLVAERARGKGIEQIVFDRHGYLYHGRIKALAESARKSGLKF